MILALTEGIEIWYRGQRLRLSEGFSNSGTQKMKFTFIIQLFTILLCTTGYVSSF